MKVIVWRYDAYTFKRERAQFKFGLINCRLVGWSCNHFSNIGFCVEVARKICFGNMGDLVGYSLRVWSWRKLRKIACLCNTKLLYWIWDLNADDAIQLFEILAIWSLDSRLFLTRIVLEVMNFNISVLYCDFIDRQIRIKQDFFSYQRILLY